ncbi:MAG: ribosome-recycling factor [Patescibacteria group bacterium]
MIDDFKKDLQKLSGEFKDKLAEVRSNRLSLSFLENIEFVVYGGKYPLKGLAHISQVTPLKFRAEIWDEGIIPTLEQEMSQRKMGITVNREGNALVINFPPLSEESRKDILKDLNHFKEDIRIQSRKTRDDFLKDLKNKKENKEIGEDIFFKTKERADDEIEKFNKEVEKIFEQKERELLS